MEFTLARQRAGQIPSLCESNNDGSGLPGQGLVIISEFVSSARVMRGGLIVNPWNVDEVG
jgi:trehalose-6-phosphate synthase